MANQRLRRLLRANRSNRFARRFAPRAGILTACAALTATLVTTGFTSSHHQHGSEPRKSHTKVGQLITVRPIGTEGIPDAGKRYSFAYISTTPSGEPTVTYGTLTLPDRRAPRGGYPVVAWAPGTSGFAPQCAPSLTSPAGPPDIDTWVARGYAVVETDYVGWGQAGNRPVLDQRSNAAAVINAVTAAHSVSNGLANDWVVAGHSEGGGAVLWVAASAAATNSHYKLRGGIAYAPTGPGVAKFFNNVLAGGQPEQSQIIYIPITVLGAQVVDPSINIDALVTKQELPEVTLSRQECFFTPPLLQPGQYLNKGPDATKLMNYITAQDPSRLALRVPVAIYQGGKDESTVTPPTTVQMVHSLCAHGGRIYYREFPDANHTGTIFAAQGTGQPFTFAADMLHGRPVPDNCS